MLLHLSVEFQQEEFKCFGPAIKVEVAQVVDITCHQRLVRDKRGERLIPIDIEKGDEVISLAAGEKEEVEESFGRDVIVDRGRVSVLTTDSFDFAAFECSVGVAVKYREGCAEECGVDGEKVEEGCEVAVEIGDDA